MTDAKSESKEAKLKRLAETIDQEVMLPDHLYQAFSQVDRALFVPQAYTKKPEDYQWTYGSVGDEVYENIPLTTSIDARGRSNSSSSQPSVMAHMLLGLHVKEDQKVLEIGTGTGYNAALLSWLVGDQGRVYTIEIDHALSQEALSHLSQAEVKNVHLVYGNGWDGYADAAPYDRIMVTAGFERVPFTWREQLAPGGILVGNLIGNLASPLIKLIKDHTDQTVRGWFLPVGASFMMMRNQEQDVQPSRSISWETYDTAPVVEQIELSFDVKALFRNQSFLVFLQQHRPDLTMTLRYRSKEGGPPNLHTSYDDALIAESSQTCALLSARNGTSFVVVKGTEALWTDIARIHQLWGLSGKPELRDYTLSMNEEGKVDIDL